MQWLTRGESDVPTGWDWLHQREAARAAAMRFTKRRTEYLLRRFTGKSAVAAVLGLPLDPDSVVATCSRIAVLNAPGGAPYVQVDGSPLGLDISLTDRAGWAVSLVGPDLGRVGVDLEIVEPRSAGFVRDFLTATEAGFVNGLADGVDRHAAANLMWSAKEAALKVLRTGLRADTRTVEVDLMDFGAPAVGWRPLQVRQLGADGSHRGELPGWWRRDGHFVLTIVTAASAPAPVELAGSRPLATAEPVHSWLANPVAGPPTP